MRMCADTAYICCIYVSAVAFPTLYRSVAPALIRRLYVWSYVQGRCGADDEVPSVVRVITTYGAVAFLSGQLVR